MKTGLIVSAIVPLLLAIFGPAIRRWYGLARDKMRAVTETAANRSRSKRSGVSREGLLMPGLTKR